MYSIALAMRFSFSALNLVIVVISYNSCKSSGSIRCRTFGVCYVLQCEQFEHVILDILHGLTYEILGIRPHL